MPARARPELLHCPHPRLVLHRRGEPRHEWPARDEARCACRPALLCPQCDAELLRDEVCLTASSEVVDELRSHHHGVVLRSALN